MKLPFASPAWVAEARKVLQDLVQAQGQDGVAFSVCERFTDAPRGIFPTGVAAWHFVIDGRSVTVDVGEIEMADAQIAADYATALPVARLVYTPEYLAEREAERQARRAARPPTPTDPQAPQRRAAPAYMVELHNRMARITA